MATATDATAHFTETDPEIADLILQWEESCEAMEEAFDAVLEAFPLL